MNIKSKIAQLALVLLLVSLTYTETTTAKQSKDKSTGSSNTEPKVRTVEHNSRNIDDTKQDVKKADNIKQNNRNGEDTKQNIKKADDIKQNQHNRNDDATKQNIKKADDIEQNKNNRKAEETKQNIKNADDIKQHNRTAVDTKQNIKKADDIKQSKKDDDTKTKFKADDDTRKPNVVIFLVDDLGIGDVGCFGNTTIRTPNIDSICRRGAKLSQHTAGDALCTPSRSALYTGRLPVRTGMATHHRLGVFPFLNSKGGLPPNETTFAKVFQGQGYKTALIGKWHLGLQCETKEDLCHHPNNHGFGYYFGLPLSNYYDLKPGEGRFILLVAPNFFIAVYTFFAVGILTGVFIVKRVSKVFGLGILILYLFILLPFWIFWTNSPYWNGYVMRNDKVVEQPVQLENMTRRLVGEGLQFLEQRQHDKNPFMLMMSWLQVHTALHASVEFKGKSAHGAYGDEVEEMDWSVGEILKGLNKLGLDDNTLVYFTSDNGGQMESGHPSGYPTGGYNGLFPGSKSQGGQDGGMREPSAIMWPGKIKPGTNILLPTSHLDMFPTLLSIINQNPPTDRTYDGVNIMPLLQGKVKKLDREFLYHYCGVWLHAVRYSPVKGNSIYKVYYYWPKWDAGPNVCKYPCTCQLHHYKLDKPKMFNIQEDPYEQTPLDINNQKAKEILSTVETAIQAHKNTVEEVPSQFTFSKLMFNPFLLRCCNFPVCSCSDDVNALQYVPPWNR